MQSLAQGVVCWDPPEAAIHATANASWHEVCQYGADDGDPELRAALISKLARSNNLERQAVMVTAGANQAFVNLVLTMCDGDEAAVIFRPYYFNHMMALQMSGVRAVEGPCDEKTLLPDVAWLRELLAGRRDVKMVVLCNPSNPTGVVAPRSLLDEVSSLCREHRCWLAVDNTYENFVYDRSAVEDLQPEHPSVVSEGHSCVAGPHVVNIFSFSKNFGMMGWRVGYLAYEDAGALGEDLLKVQDTIAICPTRLSQRVALAALTKAGAEWVAERVAGTVLTNRRVVVGAVVRALGREAIMGSPRGAIYIMVRLPPPAGSEHADDTAAMLFLADKHGVVVIPGGACGAPGCIRVAFANLEPQPTRDAAEKLEAGLRELRALSEATRTGATGA